MLFFFVCFSFFVSVCNFSLFENISKIYLKTKHCRNRFKFWNKIILNLNSISNQTIIQVLKQNKDKFRYLGLRISLRL